MKIAHGFVHAFMDASTAIQQWDWYERMAIKAFRMRDNPRYRAVCWKWIRQAKEWREIARCFNKEFGQ